MKRKTIKDYYLKYGWLFLIGIIADIVVDIAQTFVPEFLGNIVDIVSNYTNVTFNDIALVIKNIFIVAFILLLGRMLLRFGIIRAAGKMEAELRHDMFLKAERLSQRYYHENKIGTIMSWFSSDVETVEEFAGWGTIMIVDVIFISVISIFMMIRLSVL